MMQRIIFRSCTLLFIICLALVCSSRDYAVSAQEPSPGGITANHLFGVDCVDRLHTWLVGLDGIVLATSDGGTTWEQQKSGTDVNLCDVSFVGPQVGWIVGRTGIILHTKDGGKTWVNQQSPAPHHLFAVTFIDAQHGWAVGDYGTIVHTRDGGTTWINQGSGEDRIYNDISFTDRSNGWLVGEYGLIYRTHDGGRNWERQECAAIIPLADETRWESFPPSLYGVFFADAAHGWACGMDGVIITTSNGGSTWEKQTSPAEARKITLYQIHMYKGRGHSIGQKGTYITSRDGGLVWQQHSELTRTKFWLRDIDFCDDLTGFAVGSRGTILKTDNGGTSWRMISGIPVQASNDSRLKGEL